MSLCIIAEIWLHKEGHYQKYFIEKLHSLIFYLKFSTVILDDIVHALNL